MSLIILYVPTANEKEAVRISRHLLRKKLVACANFFPIKSMYRWKGKIASESEMVLLLKTLKKNSNLVQKEIIKLHSYDVPCILEFPATPNGAFGRWVEEQLS